MLPELNDEVKKVLNVAKKEMKALNHPYVGSEHLLLAILKTNNKIVKCLKEYNVTYQSFKDELIKVIGIGNKKSELVLYTPLLKSILELATIDAKENSNSEVTLDDVALAMCDECEGVAIRIIISMGVDVDNIYEQILTSTHSLNATHKLLIEDYGVLLNNRVLKNEIDPVIGRDNEVQRLMEILLRRTKNNPLLVGAAGVGKTAIVEELARRIVNGNVPTNLQDKKIYSVSMASLVAGTKYRGEFEERLSKIVKEVEEDNTIIIFIDELHTLVGAGGADGAIDASNILKPALARGKLHLIGATTLVEYKEFIEKDKAFDRRFQLINVQEPTLEIVKSIIMTLKPIYEKYHNVSISEEIVNYMIDLSNRYIYDRKMPDKVIDILDEVSSMVSLKKVNNNVKLLADEAIEAKSCKNNAIFNKDYTQAKMWQKKENILNSKVLRIKNGNNKAGIVTKKDVAKVIELKSSIPVFESEHINENAFSKKLSTKICGQNEAIKTLYGVTKKIKMGLDHKKRPYSLLFLGSTGVGKTLLAKEYAYMEFGRDNFIRLDMSEYQEEHSISKLIGSPPGYVGYDDNCNIFEQVREKPFSVLLLDEVDKANAKVLDVFMQILDEGMAKNAKGMEVVFSNTIIIMTSNAVLKNNTVGFGVSKPDKQLIPEAFTKSFINRIDCMVHFNEMTPDIIKQIINKKLKEIRTKYKETGINIVICKSVVEEVFNRCNYDVFGARQIDKVISNYIDSIIVDKMILGNSKIVINTI